jgi:ATP phosphoribosyltransferase
VDAPARRLRLGLPKGSLQATTEKLFTLAGFDLRIRERSYYPDIDDPDIECVLIRAQEMARYVQQGVLDAGITGIDWTLENRARVKEVSDLRAPWPNYNPVRWVVAVKDDSKIRRPPISRASGSPPRWSISPSSICASTGCRRWSSSRGAPPR